MYSAIYRTGVQKRDKLHKYITHARVLVFILFIVIIIIILVQ